MDSLVSVAASRLPGGPCILRGLGSLFRWFTLLRHSHPCPHLRRWPLVTLSPARISLSLEFRKQIPHLQGMSLWSLSRSCMSRPQCITPSPGITCFISMDATNAFPCPMLYLPSVSDSFLNLYLFIFQIMRSLSLSSFLHYHFQFSTTVFPKTSLLSASPVHSLSLCCWAGRILAGVSGFQREQSQAECDRKRLPDSAKAINIMLFPMFLLQKKKKSFQLQKLFLVQLRICFFKSKLLILITALWKFHIPCAL